MQHNRESLFLPACPGATGSHPAVHPGPPTLVGSVTMYQTLGTRHKKPSPPMRARSDPFEAEVGAFLRRNRLLGPGDPVLVALSGGPDSTALLAVLAALSRSGRVGAVRACHVDHGLREGSHEDQARCAALCASLGVPFDARRVQVGPGNLQAEARRARYAALRAAAREAGAARIATGHTRTDQAETVLLRLLRGAGARGLSGIPARRGALVRPLLGASRPEVLGYLSRRALPFLEDPTNASPRFLRNRVRAELLPVLAALSPAAERHLARAASLLRADERALDRAARALCRGPTASIPDLAASPLAVRRRAVRRLWRAASGRREGLAAAHVAAVLRLLRRRAPGRVSLPGGLEARAAYGALELGRPLAEAAPLLPVEVPGPGAWPVPCRRVRLVLRPPAPGGAAGPVLRAGAVGWPLLVRSRRPGDRFRPRGGRGTRKLQDWLVDRKVPRAARDRLLLLADRTGRVLWIPELSAEAEGLADGQGPELALALEPLSG